MSEHDFCRTRYKLTARDSDIPYHSMSCYKYYGFRDTYQVYQGNRILGDFCGCCAWAAKVEAIEKMFYGDED